MNNTTKEILKHHAMRWILSTMLWAFIILKLTGRIDWPWVWVLSPFWIPLTLAVATFAVSYIWLCSALKKIDREENLPSTTKTRT